jgi:anthranilate synthase component 2
MILLLDNYDSFTYNLYQAVGEICPDIQVFRNDAVSACDVERMAPSHILISPGPGRPADAGVCEEVIRRMRETPILGVCLGHQAICEVFGAEVAYARQLVHGKRSSVQIANGSPIFYGLPPIIDAGRYHSLAARRETIPDELLIIAEDDDGEVMGVKHRDFEIYGVQFHPESILTPEGSRIIENFLEIGGAA